MAARHTAGIQGWTFGAVDAERREQRTIELLVNGRFGRDRSADAARARIEVPVFMTGLPDFEVRGSTDLDVRGATSAEQTRCSYTGTDDSQVHGVWIAVTDRAAVRSAVLQLTSVSPLPRGLLQDLVDSLELAAPSSEAATGGTQARAP